MCVERVPIYVYILYTYNLYTMCTYITIFYNDTRGRYNKFMILSLWYRGRRVVVDGFTALLCHYMLLLFFALITSRALQLSDLIEGVVPISLSCRPELAW